jgi:hypothetical protein
MRALMMALALISAPGAALAFGGATATVPGADVVRQKVDRTPKVPKGTLELAEKAVKRDLVGPDDSTTFRSVRVKAVESIKHGAFSPSIDGPVSVVCGEYVSRDPKGAAGDYRWFFVAIKDGKVLWTADENAGQPDEAHDSCQNAGLVKDKADRVVDSSDGR